MWILENYSWAAEMETVYTHMPDNPPQLMKIHTSSPHKPRRRTYNTTTRKAGRKAQTDCPQIPHHMLGIILSTIDTDPFNLMIAQVGASCKCPSKCSSPCHNTCWVTLNTATRSEGKKKNPVLRGRGKVGKSYLRGSQLRKKKKGNVLPGAQSRSWGH